MVLGLLFGLGAVKVLCDEIEDYGKAAYPGLDTKDFDLKNMTYGINPKDVQKIAARCGVRPKNGILPYFGYKSCLSYVRKYANKQADIDQFITEWKYISKKQEKEQALILQNSNENEYDTIVNLFKGYKVGNHTIILTYDHWRELLPNEHQQRINDVYQNTYIGTRAIRPPIIRFDPNIYGKRTEVWEVHANAQDKQHDRQTEHRWTRLYTASCKKRGYDPKL